jgi:hypothetical protein
MISHSMARSLQQRRRGIRTAVIFIGDIISLSPFGGQEPNVQEDPHLPRLALQDKENEELDKKLRGQTGFMG